MVCFYTASRDALEVINSISMSEFADNRAQIEYDSSITAAAASSAGQGAHSAQAYNAKSPVHQDKAWSNSLYRFWAGNDDYRNRTFKLFPRVCKASWAIQAAVGTKPALIGNKKLELKYSRGANYLEVDIDLGSSTIATHILGMVRTSFCFCSFAHCHVNSLNDACRVSCLLNAPCMKAVKSSMWHPIVLFTVF